MSGDGGAPGSSSPFNQAQILELVRVFTASRWSRIQLEVQGTRVVADKHGRPPAAAASPPAATTAPPTHEAPARPAPAPDAPASAEAPPRQDAPAAAPPRAPERHADLIAVTSPAVGVFWRSPSPGAPAFAEVGQHVDAEQQVGIVEVMKLMNQVVAPVAGEVVAIPAENAAMVEFGQELMLIRPTES